MINNYSKQRECILEILKNTKTHPSIEELCTMVQETDDKISKSTVYRNVNILVDNNIIRKIVIPNGPDRYDFMHIPHHHMVCTKCLSVIDFEYDFNKDIQMSEIEKQIGTSINMDSVTINGICNNCKTNKF